MSSKRSKKKNSQEHAHTLDLGLSALLSGDSAEVEPPAASEATLVKVEGEMVQEQAPPRPPSEFEELSRKNDWAGLVKLAESKLALADEPEFRLWWVRGHLGAFSMPVSFLAGPLEAVCRRARDQQLAEQLRPVLRETGALALARLTEIGARDQVESLRDSLFDAGVLDARSDSRGPRATDPRREEVHSMPPAEVVIAPEQASYVPKQRLAQSPFKHLSVRSVGGLAMLLVLGVGAWFWLGSVLSVPTVITEESFVSEPISVEQIIPALERRGAVGSLSALFYSIEHPQDSVDTAENGGADAVPGGSASKNDRAAIDQSNAPTTSAPQPPQKDRASVARNRKERVNTRSPIEGPELKDRLRRRETRAQRDSAPDPLFQGPQARVSPPVMENRNPDVFDPGGVYRVLVRTSVLANPSYAAEVVGRLDPGDRVFVEAKLGRWVRLRSKRGRGGFVLAEDVAEISMETAAR